MDFLGLKTLTVIQDAVDLINREASGFDISNILLMIRKHLSCSTLVKHAEFFNWNLEGWWPCVNNLGLIGLKILLL